MIDQSTPRFQAAIAEVLEPFGLRASPPIALFNTAPIALKALLNALNQQEDVFNLGDGVLFDATKKLVFTAAEAIELTEKEALLFKALIGSDGEISREELLKTVWGYAEGVDTHTLETHIHRLRNKLKALPEAAEWIKTTAFGYQFHGTGNA
jgi:DNA-binding response OmpR family regulator